MIQIKHVLSSSDQLQLTMLFIFLMKVVLFRDYEFFTLG